MSPEQVQLWNRLILFDVDPIGARVTFVERLASSNRWSHDYAERVQREYRRFLLLSVHAGHVVCPSDAVDQAWHQHMLDSHSYWDELCGEVLRHPLHHTPSRGGQAEEEKHRAMYVATLASYCRIFEEAPPRDIWPDADERFRENSFVRIDRTRHWVLPKPGRGRVLAGGFALAATVLMTGCGRDVFLHIGGPWDLTGPQFLLLYAGLFALLLCVVMLWRRLRRGPGAKDWTSGGGPDIYETAYLVGSRPRAIQSAVASLLQEGQLAFNPLSPWQVWVRNPLPSGAHWFEREVYEYVRDAGVVSYSGARWSGRLRERAERLDEGLVESGCLMPAARALWLRTWTAAAFVVLFCFGISKIHVGLARQRPVEYLMTFCIVTAMTAIACFCWPTRRTWRGRAFLSQLSERHSDYESARITSQMSGSRVALAVALFGSTVLAGSALAGLPTQFLNGPPQNSGDSGSSSGSGGCSGGGGGGGCGGGGGGGGGCGGCGGG